MNGSMWLLTATCLAYGAADSTAGAVATQASPAPMIVQDQRPRQDHVVTTGYSGSPDCTHAGDCGCSCEEKAGFLARLFCRLRALFQRCCGDSCCEPCVAKCQTTCPPVCADSDDCGRCHRFFRSLASLFQRSGCETPCCETPCCTPTQTMVTQMAPATVLPPVESPAYIQPVSNQPARPAMEIAKEYLDKVANAGDYSWVTGQLFYIHIHADQGLWVVRYASVDKEDQYGGSVVLAPATSMTGFREGDLVTVHGEILNQGRASRYLGGPLYRGLAVDLKDRAHP